MVGLGVQVVSWAFCGALGIAFTPIGVGPGVGLGCAYGAILIGGAIGLEMLSNCMSDRQDCVEAVMESCNEDSNIS